MLVYLSNPMGYSEVGGKRIYGKSYCRGRFGPTDIKEDEWKENPSLFLHAEYTKEWLESRFGIEFPSVTFTLDTLGDLDDRMLKRLALLVGINWRDKWGTPLLDRAARKALVKSITWALNKEE